MDTKGIFRKYKDPKNQNSFFPENQIWQDKFFINKMQNSNLRHKEV